MQTVLGGVRLPKAYAIDPINNADQPTASTAGNHLLISEGTSHGFLDVSSDRVPRCQNSCRSRRKCSEASSSETLTTGFPERPKLGLITCALPRTTPLRPVNPGRTSRLISHAPICARSRDRIDADPRPSGASPARRWRTAGVAARLSVSSVCATSRSHLALQFPSPPERALSKY